MTRREIREREAAEALRVEALAAGDAARPVVVEAQVAASVPLAPVPGLVPTPARVPSPAPSQEPERPGFDAIFGFTQAPQHPTAGAPAVEAPALRRRAASDPTPFTEAEQTDRRVGRSSASPVSDARGPQSGFDALFAAFDDDEATADGDRADAAGGRARGAERGERPSRVDRKAAKAANAAKAPRSGKAAKAAKSEKAAKAASVGPRRSGAVPVAPVSVGDDLALLMGIAAASGAVTSGAVTSGAVTSTSAADAATATSAGFATAIAAAAAAPSPAALAPADLAPAALAPAALTPAEPSRRRDDIRRLEPSRADDASQSARDQARAALPLHDAGRSRGTQARQQVAHRPPARPAASAPNRRRRGAGRILSVVAMSFVALLAVATTIPALSLLTPEDVQALALAEADGTGLDGQRVELNSDFVAQSVAPEGYETQTIEEYARAAGIRPEATFTNNPLGTIQWPFAVGVHIGDRFGYRDCAGCSTNHGGQDFNPGLGAEIQAIADGTVAVSTDDGGSLGVVMMIDHMIDGQLITSVYAHMEYDSRRFEVGDTVHVADVVGTTGNTGMSTGPHLHFEIRVGGVDGTKIDPLVWLYANTN